jgi:hypothetical protein
MNSHDFVLLPFRVLLCKGPLPVEIVKGVSQQQLEQLWTAEAPT